MIIFGLETTINSLLFADQHLRLLKVDLRLKKKQQKKKKKRKITAI